MRMICTIHENKPDVCKNWPSRPSDLLPYKECTLYFEDDKLMGECCNCGECCLKPWIIPPGYNKKFKDEPCPYLKEIK